MSKPLQRADLASAGTTQGKRLRRQQLRKLINAIQAAEFPRDFMLFAPFAQELRQETPEGRLMQNRWRSHIAAGGGVPGYPDPKKHSECPRATFLLLLQVYLVAAKARRWEQLTAGLRSPKRQQATREPVPARAATLFAEAAHDEEQAFVKLRDEVSGNAAYRQFTDAMTLAGQKNPKPVAPKVRQKFAQQNHDFTPPLPTIRLWSKPMTLAEYVAATGCARKTIQRFFGEIGAEPARRRHAAEAGRYGVDVNLKIMAQWIGQWERDKKNASGLAAATLVFAHVHDLAFEGKVLRVLLPVLKRRGLLNAAFSDAVEAHKKHYLQATLDSAPLRTF